ncbi:MAG: HAD-IIIA family hydrolase [Thermodesulfobacteriota bacterium]|nr:HAD-IIIA family hydrolase [Thermodesulfobacteriota bacterium]
MHHNHNIDDLALFEPICLLLLDVDGVLTDGTLFYTGTDTETKAFSVKDGLGLRMLVGSGIHVGIVTGRSSDALNRRCKELGITTVCDNVKDKAACLEAILARCRVQAGQTAFMGDDLPDIPLMKRVGLAIAVADAHPAVKSTAAFVTGAPGGRGAVREVCEHILHARDLWKTAAGKFL